MSICHLCLALCQGTTCLQQTRRERWWCTLAALLALDTSSYLAVKPPMVLLLSQSVMGPRLFNTGGIIWRLITCSFTVGLAGLHVATWACTTKRRALVP